MNIYYYLLLPLCLPKEDIKESFNSFTHLETSCI